MKNKEKQFFLIKWRLRQSLNEKNPVLRECKISLSILVLQKLLNTSINLAVHSTYCKSILYWRHYIIQINSLIHGYQLSMQFSPSGILRGLAPQAVLPAFTSIHSNCPPKTRVQWGMRENCYRQWNIWNITLMIYSLEGKNAFHLVQYSLQQPSLFIEKGYKTSKSFWSLKLFADLKLWAEEMFC